MSSTAVSAQQVARSGGFELACCTDIAFPLFSPEGERGWIKEWDWDPHAIFPATTIEFRRDTIFRQGSGADEAIWTIVDVDWKEHRAEYVRIAPASHAAHILVKVDAAGSQCRVTVEYTLTVLASPGESLMLSFSEESFAARMQSWQRQIESYLKTQQN
jgi:hypothetical protein